MRRSDERAAWLFVLPHLLGLLLFSALPILAALVISTLSWDVLTPPRPVGLANFQALLGDRLFHQVVANTGLYILGVVPTGFGGR
jgi:multiple sugar transport system permease protein